MGKFTGSLRMSRLPNKLTRATQLVQPAHSLRQRNPTHFLIHDALGNFGFGGDTNTRQFGLRSGQCRHEQNGNDYPTKCKPETGQCEPSWPVQSERQSSEKKGQVRS